MPYYVRVPRHEHHQRHHVSPSPPIDPDLDEEGLSKSGYDVIICGTGLVQSILASALARAGRSVLHCDGNAHYGELDAVLSLDHLAEWAQKHAPDEGSDSKAPATIVESRPGDEQTHINSQLWLSDQEVIIDLDPAGGCTGLVVHSCTSLSPSLPMPECDLLCIGTEVMTDLGQGRVVAMPTDTSPQLTVSLANEKLSTANADADADSPSTNDDDDENKETEDVDNNSDKEEVAQPAPEKSSPVAHFGFTDNDQFDDAQSITTYYQRNHNIWTKSAKLRDDILHTWGRSFALDLTPGLIYATGDAVNGLIKSGVADYLEFKSAEAIYLLMEPNGGGSSGRKQPRSAARSTRIRQKRGDNGNTTEDAITTVATSSDLQLSRVPCSKGDVFQTKLLSPVEKRRLMKFLQLASDYVISVETAKTGNEERPASADGDEEETDENSSGDRQADESAEADNIQSLNERQLLQGRSLTRPQNKVVSTSDLDTLRDYIEREVDFEEYLQTVHNLPERLRMIVIHAMAMESANMAGRYPTGRAMNDLCRHLLSLGRYGGTAFLIPMYGSGELSQSFCRSAAVHGATYLLRRPAKGLVCTSGKNDDGMVVNGVVLGGDVDPSGKSIPEKIVRAKRAIVSSESLALDAMPQFASSQRIVRRVSILSDKLIVNSGDDNANPLEQRHIIVIPPNTGTIGNECVIHDIALDESVSIAPRNTTCTVLHLTTTCNGSRYDEVKCHAALEKVAKALVDARGEQNVQEIYHCSFSFASREMKNQESALKGLTCCHKGGQSITLEAAFHKANEIFRDVCPNADFLALSKEMDEMVRERTGDRGDDSDDEQMVLESAMDLIDASANAANDNDSV